MTDRDRLIDIMAREIDPSSWSEGHIEVLRTVHGRDLADELVATMRRQAIARIKSAIAVAERAGFRWLGPDDGR